MEPCVVIAVLLMALAPGESQTLLQQANLVFEFVNAIFDRLGRLANCFQLLQFLLLLVELPGQRGGLGVSAGLGAAAVAVEEAAGGFGFFSADDFVGRLIFSPKSSSNSRCTCSNSAANALKRATNSFLA